jgi:hypothetical protein
LALKQIVVGQSANNPEDHSHSEALHAQVVAANVRQTPRDSEHRKQRNILSRKPKPATHSRIRDRHQVADQVEIVCGEAASKHKERVIPPTSSHADRPGKDACRRV